MRVKFILPALVEARNGPRRSIKYALFPPLGLATLAGYLDPDDKAELCDEHVDPLHLDDRPDLVAIEVYITNARRAYAIADHYRRLGIPVILGGLHATACPEEALAHADHLVAGPAEEAWPRFLQDFRTGQAARIYTSHTRTLPPAPRARRDLIDRSRYLVPNALVVSRGCPHTCDFCYTNSFFRGGRHFYTTSAEAALQEIAGLPGRHLFFLDDNILGDPGFAAALFDGLRPRGRVWQGAATVRSVLNVGLLDLAVASGLRSLFVGFESLCQGDMDQHGKRHNQVEDYRQAIALLHERGVMINASFVFGLDGEDAGVFEATAEWAIEQGLETATFHLLTPYPGTDLFRRYEAAGRIRHRDWDLYDTRHAVFHHPRMSGEEMEHGYRRAYRTFYRWSSLLRSARRKPTLSRRIRHFTYTAAWKKMDPVWAALIQLRRLRLALPTLEHVLRGQPQGADA